MEYLKEVKEQYEQYPYPYRNPEDEKIRLLATEDGYLERINHYCYGGRNNFDTFRVLVAGGGTGSAAIFLAEQLRDRPKAEVIYLDISTASMEIAKKRAKIRGLANIIWINDSILNLPKLRLGLFDYINCVGVLHHLEDHELALRILNAQLKEDGCMGIMVYGRHGRTAVYQMQELMRLVNGDETNLQTKVVNTKSILASLPPTNLFKRDEREWLSEVEEYGDIGLYDLFLHSRDHGFDVLELYEWVEGCGLHLVEFIGPGLEGRIGYEPATFLREPALLGALSLLSRPRRQAIAELLSGKIQRHSFYLARRTGTVASPHELDNIPFFFKTIPRDLFQNLLSHPGSSLTLTSPDRIQVHLRPSLYTAHFAKFLNGENSLRMIFEQIRRTLHAPRLNDHELLDAFLPFYNAFHDIGWMLLRHRSVPSFPSVVSLQARLNKLP